MDLVAASQAGFGVSKQRLHIPQPLRAAGHALKLTWSGERGAESSSTGECPCGWSESASSQNEVRNEYRFHLLRVLGISPDVYLRQRSKGVS